MKKIKLGTKSLYALVDNNFESEVRSWKVNKLGYVTGYKLGQTAKTRKLVYLHRLVMNAKKGEYIDHIDGDKLDNRRSRLRLCTNQQNTSNQRLKKNNTSGFKGVSWTDRTKYGRKGHWSSQIEFKRKHNLLGTFKNKHHAALMYDFWATYLFGEFAKTNFKVISQS